MKTILVTGSAGFIGSNLVLRLFKELSEGTIVGLDNLNDYYDPTLKDYRLSEIEKAKPAGIEYEAIIFQCRIIIIIQIIQSNNSTLAHFFK